MIWRNVQDVRVRQHMSFSGFKMIQYKPNRNAALIKLGADMKLTNKRADDSTCEEDRGAGRQHGIFLRVCAIAADTKSKDKRNHIDGRNHLAWITMPICEKHHTRFHFLAKQASLKLG